MGSAALGPVDCISANAEASSAALGPQRPFTGASARIAEAYDAGMSPVEQFIHDLGRHYQWRECAIRMAIGIASAAVCCWLTNRSAASAGSQKLSHNPVHAEGRQFDLHPRRS